MIFRTATTVVVVLAATAAFAQSTPPGTTPGAPILNRPALTGRIGQVANKSTDPQGLTAMRQQVEEMESTVSQMRRLLRQMHSRAAKSKTTDSLTKANLDMWELMVGQVDKQLQQMRLTLAVRENLEARRAELYRQADAKADARAQAFRASQAARFTQAEQNATGTPTTGAPGQTTGQSAERSPAVQTAPPQPAAAPPNQ